MGRILVERIGISILFGLELLALNNRDSIILQVCCVFQFDQVRKRKIEYYQLHTLRSTSRKWKVDAESSAISLENAIPILSFLVGRKCVCHVLRIQQLVHIREVVRVGVFVIAPTKIADIPPLMMNWIGHGQNGWMYIRLFSFLHVQPQFQNPSALPGQCTYRRALRSVSVHNIQYSK